MLFTNKDLVVVSETSRRKDDLHQHPVIYDGYYFPEGGSIFLAYPFKQRVAVDPGAHLVFTPYPVTGQGWNILSQNEYEETFTPYQPPPINFDVVLQADLNTTMLPPRMQVERAEILNGPQPWDGYHYAIAYPQTT
ncbi:MAG: hypothetical protein E6R03_06860 [Hyphomicrobiaceae bacterium]|nr:MAG: hypothetical protein E6R03_06860 [Hyphomicrobiaceae bacterium]